MGASKTCSLLWKDSAQSHKLFIQTTAKLAASQEKDRETDSAERKKSVPAKGRLGQSVEWCPKVASGFR